MLENKLTKKKEKVKELVNEYEDKETEIERMKEEMQILKEQTKSLTKKMKEERRSQQRQSSKNNLMTIANQNCDFDSCMEEECVEATGIKVTHSVNMNHRPIETGRQIKTHISPRDLSSVRQSRVVYMTPNKSSTPHNLEKLSKMIDNCVKMECAGCRKLIPTQVFFEHLIQNQQSCINSSQGNRSPVMSFILNKSHDAFNQMGQLRYNSTMCVSNQT